MNRYRRAIGAVAAGVLFVMGFAVAGNAQDRGDILTLGDDITVYKKPKSIQSLESIGEQSAGVDIKVKRVRTVDGDSWAAVNFVIDGPRAGWVRAVDLVSAGGASAGELGKGDRVELDRALTLFGRPSPGSVPDRKGVSGPGLSAKVRGSRVVDGTAWLRVQITLPDPRRGWVRGDDLVGRGTGSEPDVVQPVVQTPEPPAPRVPTVEQEGESGAATPANVYFPPPRGSGDWRSLQAGNGSATVEEKARIRSLVGIDWDKLADAASYSRSFASDSTVLVIRDGWLVGEWGPDRPYAVASVSKSLTGLTMAKLFELGDAGAIGADFDLDDPIAGYLPAAFAANDPRKAQIRISHLMTMGSGLLPDDNPIRGGYLGDVLSKPVKTSPNQEWSYASLPVDLLSIAVQNASGRSIEHHFNDRIAAPLGMPRTSWRQFDGYTLASAGAQIAARDLARVGYLMLRGGKWNGLQVVSTGNIRLLTSPARAVRGASFVPTGGSPFPVASDAPTHYGHLWWTNATGTALGSSVPRDAFYAHGYRETLLCVIPSLDMVVVRYGSRPNADANLRREFMRRVMASVVRR